MERFTHGWVVVDKPEGVSSARALFSIKKLCKPFKVGHAGTLDPFASGLLLVGVGAATKVMSFATNQDKEYEFTVQWGVSTDTQDLSGAIIGSSDTIPSLKDVTVVASSFLGSQSQVPPSFSAAKIDGKRAYAMARKGEEFILKPRDVHVSSLEVIDHDLSSTSFRVKCSKGFYIRGLARDICAKLNVHGHVSVLRRVAIGKFSINDAIPLAKIEKIYHNGEHENFKNLILPITAVLDDILVLQCNQEQAVDLLHGRRIRGVSSVPSSGLICCALKEHAIALCEVVDGVINPVRVFNYK